MKKTTKWMMSIIAGVLSIMMLLMTSNYDYKVLNNDALWILGCVYLVILWRYGFFEYFYNKFSHISLKSRKLIVIIVSIVITVALLIVLPFKLENVRKNNYISKVINESCELKIEPLKSKNKDSKGYKITIENIQIDGKNIDLLSLDLREGWELVDGKPTFVGDDASEVLVDISDVSKVSLSLRKDFDNGIARITIGNLKSEVDLYSPTLVQNNKIDIYKLLNANIESDETILECCCYYIAYIIVLFMLSCILAMLILSFGLREKKLKKVNG